MASESQKEINIKIIEMEIERKENIEMDQDKEEGKDDGEQKGKGFKKFEVFIPSAELKADSIKTLNRFVVDKSLYKVGKMLQLRGFNCMIMLQEKGSQDEALKIALSENRILLV